ncbi:MAG: response regulator, partial [Proteobacteria bacterium]|nr:response regulator [Pseudomonadota bacterium]
MLQKKLPILLVEDDEDDYLLTRELLEEIELTKYDLHWVTDYDAGLARLKSGYYDVILIDHYFGGHTGVELVREAVAAGCTAPMILLTGLGGRDIDVAAMQAGAADYLEKRNLTADVLERSIRYAISAAEARRAMQERVADLEKAQRKLEMQGKSLTRLADDLLIARDEARAADRAKSEFLAAMSHELRTPLNAIIGFSQIITNEMFGPIGDVKYREYVADINDSGQHLLGLINDILDLSKIESEND